MLSWKRNSSGIQIPAYFNSRTSTRKGNWPWDIWKEINVILFLISSIGILPRQFLHLHETSRNLDNSWNCADLEEQNADSKVESIKLSKIWKNMLTLSLWGCTFALQPLKANLMSSQRPEKTSIICKIYNRNNLHHRNSIRFTFLRSFLPGTCKCRTSHDASSCRIVAKSRRFLRFAKKHWEKSRQPS